MAENLAEKQADYYREVSAKTSSNVEDLFNRIVDELLLSQNKKKEEVASQNAT
jgi:major membrane immunogen (membrane-anchored lipoprotein)